MDLGAGALAVRFDERTPVAPATLVRVAGERTGARVLPDGLRWPVGAGETPLAALEGLLDRLRGL